MFSVWYEEKGQSIAEMWKATHLFRSLVTHVPTDQHCLLAVYFRRNATTSDEIKSKHSPIPLMNPYNSFTSLY